MTGLLGWVVTAAGAVLVLAALRDIFHTIWHPSGRGRLSRQVMRWVWRAGRWQVARRIAGPLGMVVVVLTWALIISLGWALVYWPHLPAGVAYSGDLEPGPRAGFLDAVYFSTVTLATLGFGDIVPEAAWLRIVVPLQALIGFALITAAVSWVLQVYPALTRRRSTAVRLALLRRAGTRELLTGGPSALAPGLLESLAAELVQLRVDLTEYAETYWFRDGEPESSLSATLGVALELAEVAETSDSGDLRFAGRLLGTAVHDLLTIVDTEFLHTGAPPRAVLDRFAEDHGQRPDGLGSAADT